MVLFVQKLLYSGKNGCIRAKVVVFVQSCCGQKLLYSGKAGYIGAKWLAKVVLFRQYFGRQRLYKVVGQKWLYSKVGQKLLYLGKSGCIRYIWSKVVVAGCSRAKIRA